MPRRKNPKKVAQTLNMTDFLSPVADISGSNKRARTGSPEATARPRHTEKPREDSSDDGFEDNDSDESGAQPRASFLAEDDASDASANNSLPIDGNSAGDGLGDGTYSSSSDEDEPSSDDSHSANNGRDDGDGDKVVNPWNIAKRAVDR